MSIQTATSEHRVSRMAESLIGSEIIKLAGEIRERVSKGEHIYNFTIGDFDPKIFPIPAELKEEIIRAYREDETNYPAADGMPELRKAIAHAIRTWQHLDYAENEILVAGGARPLIYAIFQAIVDAGDTVVFPVPSWNNNHYTHLAHAKQVFVETKPENNFMPSGVELGAHLHNAALLALCSPLNPTGTVFSREQLEEICDLVIEENNRRSDGEKPLYLMYDQIYWQLTFGETRHFDPVSLRPELRPYTIYVDGISKSFAATGVRVGWSFGPKKVIDKMKSILGHVGAWSPKAEQVATARYLKMEIPVSNYLNWIKEEVDNRLEGFYEGIQKLKSEGHRVDAIAPQAAIYLAVQVDLHGKHLPDGTVIEHTERTTAYLLNEAKLALVPFSAFGASKSSSWYRLSVGTASMDDVKESIESLRRALNKLT
ncbi:MAG: aminotransferase class I/II-fold pyridoxal phosphate-dependent enzyme [Flavobacteriales bacterium]|nr:aminotransferase class I/II-fold pyridoxal phosphate-dependent enzyme [Flavobacteriales bacterium]